MTRGFAGVVLALALLAGGALRFARLDVRPMHHDEANQAVKFGALLEQGEYRYDYRDHHGPTLYYLTLPAAWMRGQHTLASLDEYTVRGVTAAFGLATILLIPALAASAIGRTAAVAAAALMAVSPAMVFYSRMYIQESLFACFTVVFVIAVGRIAAHGADHLRQGDGGQAVPSHVPSRVDGAEAPSHVLRWAGVAGLAAGLAVSTKETSVIVLPAAVLAAAIAAWTLGPRAPRVPARRLRNAALVVIASAAAVAIVFYSSFFTSPGGVLEPLRGATTYLDRGVAPASHGHPWHYYLHLLSYSYSGGLRWSEALILVLAVAGAVLGWKAGSSRTADSARPEPAVRAFWTRYLAINVAVTALVFSAIPYKTPWNALPFYAVAIILAGIGFSRLFHSTPLRLSAIVFMSVFLAGTAHLAWQAWRAAVTYAADPRNPYVYAQTVPDAVRMAARIRGLAAVHRDGLRMQVSVIASPYEQWPLPWYLRRMPNVGYWVEPGDPVAMQAPVIVSSTDNTATFDAFGDKYVSEFFGLRPDVLLALYIDHELWERYLAKISGDSSNARCTGFTVELARPCVPAALAAMVRPAAAP